MSRQRLIALMVAALVAISGALYLSTQRNLPRDLQGSALLPSLAGELDTVTSLSVLKGAATPTVTVQKQGEQWVVANRANYPADMAKVHKLLLALSDTKIREEKTSDPANYAIIGVEDPSKPGATGSEVELTAKDGKHGVIVGKYTGQASFVRRAGEKASYSVEPGISFEAEPRYWIDTKLLDIQADKIQSIDYKTEAAYSVRRVPVAPVAPVAATAPAATAKATTSPAAATPSAAGASSPAATTSAGPPAPSAPAAPPTPPAPPATRFALEGAPSGRLAADPQTLAPSPTILSNLAVEDVAAAGDIDFGKPSTVNIALADGGVLTFTGSVVGDKHWIQVSAPKDASLSAKTSGRAFEIAGYRYDLIFRPLEQLLVPKPAPPSAKLPGAKLPSAKPPVAKKPGSATKP
jgi:Domain of unknown function (DUF4340)